MMEQTMNYVKPELIVVAVVLYFIGMGLKQSQTVKDKYIPLILGGIGIVLCAVWVIASCPISTGQEIAMAVFTAIVQGILVAGLSTYVNQTIKQIGKNEQDLEQWESLETGSLLLCDIAQGGENMSEQNEFGRVSAEELEKAFETEEQEEEKE